jgi:hypothetical protein
MANFLSKNDIYTYFFLHIIMKVTLFFLTKNRNKSSIFFKRKIVMKVVPCDQIKKQIRVSENGGLNQLKHQSSTIQVTRFFF